MNSMGGVVLTDFARFVTNRDSETENWQPAFQKALEACCEQGAALFVPCGVYNIRQAIHVPEGNLLPGLVNPGRLTIQGGGRFQTIIRQQVATENVLDWTGPGPTFKEKNTDGGTLKDLCLQGGKTCLNMKLHNYFNMDNCVVVGAAEYGIYAEGWINRFSNVTIDDCGLAGIRGTAHFNDISVRDCYISHSKIGIHLGGGHGVRIMGVGFEQCPDSAIAVMNTSCVSIRDCYFESNAYPEVDACGEKGPTYPNVVHLDACANSVVITGCIIRGGKGYWSANQIGVIGGVNHTVRENHFTNCHVAIKLLDTSAAWEDRNGEVPKRLRVMQNDFHASDKVKNYRIERKLPAGGDFLAEAVPGLIEKAKVAGCTFEEPTLSNIGAESQPT